MQNPVKLCKNCNFFKVYLADNFDEIILRKVFFPEVIIYCVIVTERHL